MELLFSLLAGLIIAFVFQLLLANLGIALGLTVLNFSPGKVQSSDSKNISLPITHLLGFGVALSLSMVLFASGLLTTEFSEIAEPRRGLIFGIILWATYWLLFIWLSSTTLSNIADSLLGAVFASGRRLLTVIYQSVGAKNSEPEEQLTLKKLAAEVSELAKEQQHLPLRLAEQQEALLAEINKLAFSQKTTPVAPKTPVVELDATSSNGSSISSPSLMSRLNLPSGRQLLQRAIDQVDIPDISDIDVQTLWHQLQSDNSDYDNVIQLDVADYLSQTPAWMFQPDILREMFYERIYDPEASPEQVKTQLKKINRTHFVAWLKKRGDLATEQVETIADQLIQIKEAVMQAMPPFPQSDQKIVPDVDPAVIKQIQDKLVAYCRYTNLDLLTPDSLTEKIRTQLEKRSLPGDLAIQIDLEAVETVLNRRQGLDSAGRQALMDRLRTASLLSKQFAPRRWAVRSGQSAKSLAEQLSKQITYYLRHQKKSALKPTQMVHDLTQLAKTSLGSFSHQLPDQLPDSLFDQVTWRQELERRRDMTADEIQQVLTGTESVWHQTLQKVNAWADSSWSEIQEQVKSKNEALLDAAGQQISKGLSAAQQTVETQVDAVKTDLQTQADAARGQVEIASWWLFSSLLLSGLSAAASGWLAVKY